MSLLMTLLEQLREHNPFQKGKSQDIAGTSAGINASQERQHFCPADVELGLLANSWAAVPLK